MVLHGIGGNTIAECKSNLSFTEALIWKSYIERYGSLNVARRIENQTGVLGSVISKGAISFSELAPLEFESNKSQLEQVIETFGATPASNQAVKEAQAKAREKRKQNKKV